MLKGAQLLVEVGSAGVQGDEALELFGELVLVVVTVWCRRETRWSKRASVALWLAQGSADSLHCYVRGAGKDAKRVSRHAVVSCLRQQLFTPGLASSAKRKQRRAA